MAKTGYIPCMLDADAIRSRRERLGLSLTEAAKLAGFRSRQHWHAVERSAAGGKSNVTLGTLNAIAKALDCRAKDLLK
jgi:transcriptional regulator with XRE-family HTH domain